MPAPCPASEAAEMPAVGRLRAVPRVLVNLLQSTGSKGGIEIYARELYRSIGELVDRRDFDFVGFASTELMARDHSWFPGEVVNSGISGENRLSWAYGELIAVARAAKAQSADLIHGPAMLGPLFPSVPVVVSMHDLLYFSHPELMQTKLFTEPVKWMEKRAAAKASRLITISETSAAAIRTYLRFPEDRIDLIPLAGRKQAAAADSPIVRRSDLFLAVGQRSPYKNFETVVRAWGAMAPESRPQLVITGSVGDDPLIPLVSELHLAEWVHLKSWVSDDELHTLLATATALIDPTLAGGSSLPTLEAMQIGLPVVLADTPVLLEVGGDAADYYRAGDPADLARAVLSLGANRRRQADLTRRGHARVDSYTWDVVARATLESFAAALSDPR
jgi:glycosyltransferase involved in cell wall biosynthesis